VTGARRVCVGLGNRFRGDDRAGLAVAERLRALVPEGIEVVAIEGDPMPLLSILERADLVLIADAVAAEASERSDPTAATADARADAIYRFDASDEPVPGAVFGSSTHAFGLAETIELARALGKHKARVVVYGIPGTDFNAGEELTAAVQGHVETTVQRMLADLSRPCHPSPEQEQSHA
jgi:hydrogenase maturation protease